MGESLDMGGGGASAAGPVSSGAAASNVFGAMPGLDSGAAAGLPLNVLLVAAVGVVVLLVLVLILKR